MVKTSELGQPEICRRISQLRQEMDGPRGKAAFAKRLGLSASTYDYYEGSRVPPVDVLVRIADLCQVDLRWLITGEGPTQTLLVGHPAIARAAELLKEHPEAQKPLLAFLELLSASMKFPAKGGEAKAAELTGLAAAGAAEGMAATEAGRAGGVAASRMGKAQVDEAMAGKRPAVERRPEAVEKRPLAGAMTPPAEAQAAGAAGPLAGVARPERPSEAWIPVLGRSAAGVAQFWSDAEAGRGTTLLGELIARHASRASRRVQGTVVRNQQEEAPVQIITLSEPDSENVAEFVHCPSIKARYADAFAVRIDGQSMSPDIEHGDLVILSPSQKAVDGKAAVVQLAQQIGVTCKLFRREGATVHLVPVNEQFPPQSFAAERVVWALRVLARVRP